MTKTNWKRYDHCDWCHATAGGPCFDLRYSRGNRVYHRDYAHRDRAVRADGEVTT
jgi:hypothetical protein